MRRVLAALFVVTLAFAALTMASASVAPSASAQSVALTAETAQQSGGDAPGGSPSIVPKPSNDGTSNLGGLAVGVVLLGGWLVVGAVLLRKGKRNRETKQA